MLLWAYTTVRAARLSFTHDESLTYLVAVRSRVAAVVGYDLPIPSNNHALNSLLTKVAALISASPFALRLPNVFAHGLYLGAALLLARHVATGYVRVLAFVVLTLNPFLLDFFSLCRGYGLACSFEMMALYLLVKTSDAPDVRAGRSLAASALAALAPLSHLSLLVFFLAYSATISSIDLAKGVLPKALPVDAARPTRGSLLLALSLQVLLAALVCAYVVPVGLKLRALGELYYGGNTGFLPDTLGSLLEASTYYKPYPEALRMALQALGAALVVCALLWSARAALRHSLRAAWVCLLPLLTALIFVVQHQVMDTNFPVDRTALFFLPMLAVALVVSYAATERPALAHALLGGAALLLCINAARSLNLRYFAQWQYDANTERMLERLDRVRGDRRVRLGASWLFEPTINYYRNARGFDWIARVHRSSLEETCDYYYYLPDDAPAVSSHHLKRIQRFKTSQATLAKRLR